MTRKEVRAGPWKDVVARASYTVVLVLKELYWVMVLLLILEPLASLSCRMWPEVYSECGNAVSAV